MTIPRVAAATGTSPESGSDRLDDRFEDIVRRLDMQYGPRAFTPGGDSTRTLVNTILSQSTTDHNSSRAFQSLQDAFPTWDEVIDAPTGEVADAIRAGGLAHQKAPRIQCALRAMRDLEASGPGLADMPVDQAMAWLSNLEGVGPKTAACVLLFALGKPVMPVDTHIARVMTRIGIVPDRTSTMTKQRILTDLVGPHAPTIYAVHVETIEHGRTVCRSRRPRCWACPLQDACDFYTQHSLAGGEEDSTE
jgi:endonuclease-3